MAADLKAYNSRLLHFSLPKRIFYLLFTQEMYPVLIFRFGKWATYECNVPLVKYFLRIIYFFLRKAGEIIAGVGIWPRSEIGPGLRIEHWGGVYIEAKIGKNCRIQQDVMIGYRGGFRGGGFPTIGDNVYVGVGAKILGEVRIGNNVIIGANAVVITDVPDNAVAVGVPAQIKWPKEKK